jgi:hypothetical protein
VVHGTHKATRAEVAVKIMRMPAGTMRYTVRGSRRGALRTRFWRFLCRGAPCAPSRAPPPRSRTRLRSRRHARTSRVRALAR